jgi:hypothetical protein
MIDAMSCNSTKTGQLCFETSVILDSTPVLPNRVSGRKRSRRSVHFEVASTSSIHWNGIDKIHTIYTVESVLNLAPKEELWVQREEILETLRSIHQECDFLQLNAVLFDAYVNTLEASYCSCCQNEADASVEEHEPDHLHAEVIPCPLYRRLTEESVRLSLLGLGRGIEPYCVPNLALVRQSARRQAIATLVQVHGLVRNDPYGEDLLGLMAAHFTQTSQRFAQTLAAADAKAVVEEALLELEEKRRAAMDAAVSTTHVVPQQIV